MRLSHIIAGLIASIISFGATLAILINAATAIGATPMQTISWVSAISFSIACSSFLLSWRYRMPIITSWSTPSLALLGATAGYDMSQTVGAFILCAIAIMLTALIKPIALMIARVPAAISAGMLAGVLLNFVIKAMMLIGSDTIFAVALIILFFIVRRFQPSFAVLVVLIAGLVYTSINSSSAVLPPLEFAKFQFIVPSFNLQAAIGLALPLYLVTMASQNLPGLAVLRASGYTPPVNPCFNITGFFSLITACLGASTTNLAAISAAICTGVDAGKDPNERWRAGVFYASFYFLFAIFSSFLVNLFSSLPATFIVLISGLSLLGALTGALTQALGIDRQRLAAIITFTITASNIQLFQISASFWALFAGLIVYLIGEPTHK